jgi:hypothetical protein
MNTTAKELRTLVCENSLELGRLSEKQLGKADYTELTTLYRNALDALTEWAGKGYKHQSTQDDVSNAFEAVKAILSLYATDEDRIVIDKESMQTMRDLATKPKRLYSKEYTMAEKARKYAENVVKERIADLIELGAPEFSYDKDTFVAEGKAAEYAESIRETDLNTNIDNIDMLAMFEKASAVLTIKTNAVKAIKAKGGWTYKRPVPVADNEFAELVENYIADCLTDNYNIKTSKAVRDGKAEAKAENKLFKEKLNAEING